jgi:GNAT superfamily N-acetyltransferase
MGFSEWRVETYRPGDEEQILELFHASFGERKSAAWWRWKYLERSESPAHILLVRDVKGDICAHYAALPFTICRGKEEWTGALRLDMMVRSDYRHKGIADTLVKAIQIHADPGKAFAYGFPSPSSMGVSRKTKRHHLDEIPIYWRLGKTAVLFAKLGCGDKAARLAARPADLLLAAVYRALELIPPAGRRFRLRRTEGFAAEAPAAGSWERKGENFHTSRDASFLEWRFDRNPETDYTVFLLTHGDGSTQPLGYAVLAIQEIQGLRIGFIVDLLVDPPCMRPARLLLSRAARWFGEEDVDVLSCIMTGKNAYTRALRSLGFIRLPHSILPRSLHLWLRVNDPDIDEAARDPRNWIITWADTDLV